MQAVDQVWNNKVSELQKLLGDCGKQKACHEGQTPEQGARLEGVEEVPPGEDVWRD